MQLGIPEIPEIVINEFMAGNSATIADNYNEYEDWIEIYNKGNTPVNVGNMYITDDLSDPTKYQIPDLFPDSTTIAPYDFLLLWADSDINQGILHLDFKLKNDGEQIGIFYSQYSAIDTLEYGQQYTDTSFGRSYDGSNAWIYFPESTPGYTNSLSINENQTSEIKCYPVPTNDILCFDLPVVSHIAILLYSSEGKLVLQKSIFDKTGSIDISSFPNGLYFLKITSNDRIYYQKIIKNQN
ncbi:MAG: lamin tail domain-containing protein [Bacteroidota bacterium]|nr:lamin tail domain-containing protein [Bacteroidota bacterium]